MNTAPDNNGRRPDLEPQLESELLTLLALILICICMIYC